MIDFTQEETQHINNTVKAMPDTEKQTAIATLQAFENYRSTVHILKTKQFYPEEFKAVDQITEFHSQMTKKLYDDIYAKYELSKVEKEKKEALVMDAPKANQ